MTYGTKFNGLVLLLALLLPALLQAVEPTPVKEKGVVVKTQRVKDERGTKFKLKKNQTVDVLFERGKWYWVKTHAGRQAWVKKKYLRLLGDAPAHAANTSQQSAVPAVQPIRSQTSSHSTPTSEGGEREVRAAASSTGKTGELRREGKTRIAVLDLKGTENMSPKLVAFLTNVVTETLDAMGPFKAVSSADIARVLEYQAANQMLGCDKESCYAELSNALGARHLISGEISQVGELFVVQLKLHDPRDGRVIQRVSREHRGEPEALFEQVRVATKVLVRDLLQQRSGTLKLSTSEEGATIKVDDIIIGTSPLDPQELGGGMHTLLVEKEGFVAFKQDLEMKQGQTIDLFARLKPSEEYRRSFRRSAQLTRSVALVTMGAGVLAAGVSGFFFYDGFNRGVALNQAVDDYNKLEVREASRLNTIEQQRKNLATVDMISLTSAGVGGVALLGGTVIFLLSDDPDRYE